MLTMHQGQIRFRVSVIQRQNNREAIKPALIFTTVFVFSSLFLFFGGEVRTWWVLFTLLILGLASAFFWLLAFFPLLFKSEKAERMVASCLNGEHLQQLEPVIKEAVSGRLTELARTVVYLQNNDPTCDHSKKQEFCELFDAAKLLGLIDSKAGYGHFFLPATEFVKSDLP